MTQLLFFTAFTLAVGFVAWWLTRGSDNARANEYFLAGNSLPWFVITGSLLLTNLSTEQLIGLNGGAYASGAIVMAWEVVASAALVFMALYFMPRYWAGKITTVPEFLERRFDKTTRRLLGGLFLLSLVVNFLPFVLYSGAIAMNSLFDAPALLGLPQEQTTILMVWAIGCVGAIYAVFGGLKAVAISDTINGVGLLLGGLLVPILGLVALGDGSLLDGAARLLEHQRPKLDPIGSPQSAIPLGTLFTGLLLINVYYWCTNQTIVQRVFGAKSLAEAQKGLLATALLKLLGPLYLVLPGIIALELFGPTLANGDFAYPMLVEAVLPTYLVGLFGGVMFGAILSSFNSALHSAATLFGLDLYKGMIRPDASEKATVVAGKLCAALLAVFAMSVAPMIADAPDGLYNLMKKINAIFNIPILAVVVMGIATRRVTAKAAKIALPLGMGVYLAFTELAGGQIAGHSIHWLHFAAINFAALCLFMLLASPKSPARQAPPEPSPVPAASWPRLKSASILVLVLVLALYVGLHLLARS